ncbi:folylpolyglutamate synthase isoform X2 [Ziziphus jujuba]|uniref:Folylpolyglutamate synthase isoform X2 n=1 Tax=Ziziphus jujuba TaxID=326968 RepID=A0ABM3I6P3_ZIZJJ|nr:folylpolyglutamate synthase isoform X2 [Ziziphus jujuba]
MLIDTKTYLKGGIFEVSCFHKRNCHIFLERRWSSTSFPACLGIRDSTARGCGYIKMSSQVVEKMRSNVVVKEYSEDFPFASSYESAMEALSSLITRQKRGGRSSIGGKYGKLERMSMYLKMLDLEEHIEGLKIIHVAGTKGKGSTCTFCEAILRECGLRTGLFTSPHLVDVRERFRLDGLEITENKFLQYFWECWRKLEVDVAIIEVGLGGKNDSTNVINEPVVCGITSLGMDHTDVLGNTLGQIASHKAGIFKPKIPAFTVSQSLEAMDVIQEIACQLMVPLEVAQPVDHKKLKGLELSLAGDHQFVNAGLAVSLCKCWLQRTGNWEKLLKNDILEADLPDAFLRGLSTAYISGRAQIVHDTYPTSYSSSHVSGSSCGDLIFYLDGAHSPESMEVCGRWFSSASKGNKNSSESEEGIWGNGHLQHKRENMESSCKMSKQILLFNCMDVRDPQILLPRLVSTCASSGTHFSKALFVPSISAYNKVTSGASVIPLDNFNRDLSWQFHLQRLWERILHGRDVDTAFDNGSKMDHAKIIPHEFLYEDATH